MKAIRPCAYDLKETMNRFDAIAPPTSPEPLSPRERERGTLRGFKAVSLSESLSLPRDSRASLGWERETLREFRAWESSDHAHPTWSRRRWCVWGIGRLG